MNRVRWLSLFAAAALSSVGTTASAFELRTRSEGPSIPESELRAASSRVAAEVGVSIPETPDIKVSVFTFARPSKVEGQTLYLHRVQLTKAMNGGAPYPVRAWLPIKTVERFGIYDAETSRAKLDEALREFYTDLKSVDPAVGFH